MYITEEKKDSVLAQKIPVLLANATANKAVLNLGTSDLAEMGKVFGDFTSALTAANAAKVAQSNATQDKDTKKATTRTLIAKWAKTWRANAAVPDAILDSLMMPNHSTPPTKTPPTQPLGLSLSVSDVGLVTLKWKRNGNTPGTIFNVETASSASGDWTTFDMTTKAKLDYQGTAGQEVWFRVSAKRNGLTSQFSLPISLWAGGSGAELSVAA